MQDVSQKVWGAEMAWEPAPTPSNIWAGSCLCRAVLNSFVCPQSQAAATPLPHFPGTVLEGMLLSHKNQSQGTAGLGKSPIIWLSRALRVR